MPPAFNLSQDQTLQFDLDFALRNRSELHFSIHERLRSQGPGSEDPRHFASHAHAYRLLIFKDRSLLSAKNRDFIDSFSFCQAFQQSFFAAAWRRELAWCEGRECSRPARKPQALSASKFLRRPEPEPAARSEPDRPARPHEDRRSSAPDRPAPRAQGSRCAGCAA